MVRHNDRRHSRTIYYKDGTKEMFVSASANINVKASRQVSYSEFVITPPPSFPLKEVLELLKNIVENVFGRIGAGCALLALTICNRIKGLRHNRPKDYNGVNWRGKF
jgi:hypothetical protein